MSYRQFYLDPPTRNAVVVERTNKITGPWLLWADFVARRLGKAATNRVDADPPSIPAGGTANVTAAMPGAELGDWALASFSAPNPDVVLLAQVTAAAQVTVTFWNRGAAPVDLGAGTLTIRLEKR